MFESAELGHSIDKKPYNRQAPKLREALLNAQTEVVEKAKFPVVILIGGVDGAGKGETVNLLNEWMDPRHIQTHAMGAPTDEERERPPMWRFWRALPPKGKIGIFFGSWYTQAIKSHALGEMKVGDFEKTLEDIVRFERMLADEGALILKFWFHLSKKRQRKRLRELEARRATRWRVTKADLKNFEGYDDYRKVSELALRHTSTARAPWTVIEGFDARYRDLSVGKLLLESMRAKVEDRPVLEKAPAAAHPSAPAIDNRDVLKSLDLTKALSKGEYSHELAKYEARLNRLSRAAKFKDLAVAVVFEGNDAAGKGGAIRRITGALDARQYHVIPIAAPTDDERAQPYLWRFWRQVPRRGKFAIFDRSWYGRVLVERVEGFASTEDWMRAYAEINDFEQRLAEHRVVVVKLWLSISQEEQLARFEAREKTGFKRFKITRDDWRNRKKWSSYELAVCDMVDRTSTDVAPWNLVEANDKYYARIKAMKTLCERIEAAM